jgi:hypothetical protein
MPLILVKNRAKSQLEAASNTYLYSLRREVFRNERERVLSGLHAS